MLLAAAVASGAMGRKLARTVRCPDVAGEMVACVGVGACIAPSVRSGALLPGRDLFDTVAGVALALFVVGLPYERRSRHDTSAAAISTLRLIMSLVPPLIVGVAAGALYPASGATLKSAAAAAVASSVTALPVLLRLLDQYPPLRNGTAGREAITGCVLIDIAAWISISVLGASGEQIDTIVPVALLAAASLGLRTVLGRSGVRPPKRPLTGAAAIILAVVAAYVLLGRRADVMVGLAIGLAVPSAAPWGQSLNVVSRISGSLLPVLFLMLGMDLGPACISKAGEPIVWAIILLAGIAKFAGAFGAARAGGLIFTDSWAYAALMGVRGATGLAVIGTGVKLHLLAPETSTALVILAVLTTVVAAPLLRVGGAVPTVARRRLAPSSERSPASAERLTWVTGARPRVACRSHRPDPAKAERTGEHNSTGLRSAETETPL